MTVKENEAANVTNEDQVEDDQVEQAEGAADEALAAGDDDWTEEDMRLLSDEERAALFDDPDEDDEGGGGDTEIVEPAAEAEAEDDEDAIVGTSGVNIPALDDQIKAMEEAKEAAFDAWEDGELGRDDYLAKLKEIDEAKVEVVTMRAVAAEKENAVYQSFINTARSYFNDNPVLATPEHVNAYDQRVRQVTKDPAYQHMTHRQMLAAAHTIYATEAGLLGIDVPMPAKAKAKAADPAPVAEAAPAPKPKPASKAPMTLANVPSAASVSVSDGKYSAIAQRLENASAEEYERILGSMSTAEQEAFASMDV